MESIGVHLRVTEILQVAINMAENLHRVDRCGPEMGWLGALWVNPLEPLMLGHIQTVDEQLLCVRLVLVDEELTENPV